MGKIGEFLDGKKTYIGAAMLLGLGIFMCTQGDMEGGFARIAEAIAIIGGRSAIGKALQ